jgi:hypothetical protein
MGVMMNKYIILLLLSVAAPMAELQANVGQKVCSIMLEKLIPWGFGLTTANKGISFIDSYSDAKSDVFQVNTVAMLDTDNYNVNQLVHGFSIPLAISYIMKGLSKSPSGRLMRPRSVLSCIFSLAAIYGTNKIQ